MAPVPDPRSQIFTCTAVPTPTQPWLIHRSSSLRYQPNLNARASSFTPGAKNHTTNIERLSKILGEIQKIELNIELRYRNIELERVVRDMDAQLRGVEDCGMLDMVATGAEGPPVRGYIWFRREGDGGRKVVCGVTCDAARRGGGEQVGV
jgi:hypothetical protein